MKLTLCVLMIATADPLFGQSTNLEPSDVSQPVLSDEPLPKTGTKGSPVSSVPS